MTGERDPKIKISDRAQSPQRIIGAVRPATREMHSELRCPPEEYD